jgi:4-amino-4-deoxy-L-arabinose transferase-like glycosyltransferase
LNEVALIDTHFTTQDLSFLIPGIVLIAAGSICAVYGKSKPALLLIIGGGFTLRLWMAFADPFVHIWDEQYHALVARNMQFGFFHPVLVHDPVVPTDPTNWTHTETWLHKPPFFLWLMGISAKIFGASYWSIRIPSVLLSTGMIYCAFVCGKILKNESTGLIAAILVASSSHLINIVSGFLNTDQNDVIFIALLFFNVTAWLKYIETQKVIWLAATIILSAAAVLTKWLPGLFIYGVWGAHFLLSNDRTLRKFIVICSSFVSSAVIAFSWYAYAAIKWPAQWAYTSSHYNEHFKNNFGHPGSSVFHLEQWLDNNGWLLTVAALVGMIVLIRKPESRVIAISFLIGVTTVFVFYTLVPAKMPLFTVIVTPLLLLFSAASINSTAVTLLAKHTGKLLVSLLAILLAVGSFLNINMGRLEHYHTSRDVKEIYRKTRLNNSEIFKSIAGVYPENTVIFNAGTWNSVALMFYTGYTAYDKIPDAYMIESAKKQKRTIVVFTQDSLPDYIANDSEIIIRNDNLIRNEY